MTIFQFLLLTIAVILTVTLVLVAVLLYAKARLSPGGKVTIKVNGKKKRWRLNPGTTC